MAANAGCKVDDCPGRHYGRGWCAAHYRHWKRYGDPVLPVRPTEAERFWRKVDTTGDCWIWLAHRDVKGYGTFSVANGKMIKAHRWAYIDACGPIPVELTSIDHLCRNRSCVRPAHLEAVTPAENTRRGLAGILQRATTHCPQGHPYDAENTYVATSSGRKPNRHCITCSRESTRAWRQRQKEMSA